MQLRRFEPLILALACILPTLVTLAYFVWAAGSASAMQQGVYAVSKVVQFALPIVWMGWVHRSSVRWPSWTTRGMGLGLGFGLVIAMATFGLYLALRGQPPLEQALEPMREKIAGLGVATPWRFIAIGVFYSAIHSLLEEYYWRWFVFARMQTYMPLAAAIALSSIAFSAHHLVVLWVYFAHAPWMAVLLTAAIAAGGAFWAWLYHRSKSIFPVWWSHLLVDAGIFAAGYHLARPLF